MSLNNLFGLLKSFESIIWEWDNKAIENILLSLNWKKVEKVNHRHEYATPEGFGASVYFNDDYTCFFIEIELDVFVEVERLDELEYEDKIDEFYDKFEMLTKEVTSCLGSPIFSDGSAAKGFPEDQDAIWLSLWNKKTARYMLQQKHEGREIPFRICFVVTPFVNP